MVDHEPRHRPEWARKERERDRTWIYQNLPGLWVVAQAGYQVLGRGSVLVDTTITIVHGEGEGHPLDYLDQEMIEALGDKELQQVVAEYEPDAELVATLFKDKKRMSSYRVRVVAPEESQTVREQETEESPEEPGEDVPLEVPDLETLREWLDEGICEAACPHQCVVEPDGTCPHGKPSWLLKLGLI